jgi:hypothetical protein
LIGYKLGDVAIDTGLSYAKAFSPEDMAINDGGTLLSAAELADLTKSAKNIGSYELYGELGNNPLVVDAKDKNWYNLDFEGMHTTDEIVDWANKQGYTSVTFKDIYDGGEKSNVYVFFDSKELKSADNVTYDNDGNVIPLSKRFDNNERDIRYQISKQRRDELDERGVKTLAEWSALSKGEKSYVVQSSNISKRVLMKALKDKDASIASEAARSEKLNPQDVASCIDELSEAVLGALMFRSAYTPTEKDGGFVLPDDVYLKAFASKKALTRLEALQAVMTHHRPIAKEMYREAESDKELAEKLPQLVGTIYSLDDLGEIKSKLEEVKSREEDALKKYSGEPQYISLADYYGKVDADNYYVATDANFGEIASGDYKKVQGEWDKMKESGKYEWHQSPYSLSEYLIDKGNWDVYRFSDHWGKVASCEWTLNGEAKQNHFAIGKANLKDFTRKNYGIENPAFDKYKAEFNVLSKQFSELNGIYNSLTKDAIPEPIAESINRGTGFDKYIRVDERNAVDNESIARAIKTGYAIGGDTRFQLRSADDYATELENDSERKKWVIDYKNAVKRGSHQSAARAMNRMRDYYVNEAKANGVDVTTRYDEWRKVKADLESQWGKVSKTAWQSAQEVNNFAEKMEQEISTIDASKGSGMKAQITSVTGNIKKWIGSNMPSEVAKEMGSKEISALYAELTNVDSLNSRKETTDEQREALKQRLSNTLRNIRQATNGAEIRRLANVVNDILTKTKTEKLNDRGVLEAKTVDSLTATIFKAVKGSFAKTNSMRLNEELKAIDDEIHSLDAELGKTTDEQARAELQQQVFDKRNEFETKQKEAWDAALNDRM